MARNTKKCYASRM